MAFVARGRATARRIIVPFSRPIEAGAGSRSENLLIFQPGILLGDHVIRNLVRGLTGLVVVVAVGIFAPCAAGATDETLMNDVMTVMRSHEMCVKAEALARTHP
jgi:hypothetical protein